MNYPVGPNRPQNAGPNRPQNGGQRNDGRREEVIDAEFSEVREDEPGRNRMTHPLDKDIERARWYRFWVLVGSVAITAIIGGSIGSVLATNIVGDLTDTTPEKKEAAEFFISMFRLVGIGAGLALIAALMESRFLVRNQTTGFFVTVDNLAALLGREEVNVVYGPGTHISLPWESRNAEGNISVTEEGEEFPVTVQCLDGVITGTVSYRLRPDPRNLVAFQTGVAAITKEIRGLINSFVVGYMSKMPARQALLGIEDLNDALKSEFVVGLRPLEKRFGVQFGDVTAEGFLPNAELQKTMSALLEADVIFEGTAKMLGLTVAEARTALRNGKISDQTWRDARDRFLSVSGNLENMNINRYEVELGVHGLDPELAKVLAEFLKSPAGKAFVTGAAAGKKGGGKKKK